MSKNTVLPKDKGPNLYAQASTALDLQKRLDAVNALLNPIKEELRAACTNLGNNGFTIEVEGKGKVAVSKASEGGEQYELVVDESVFNTLDEQTRDRLITLGVVETVTKIVKPRESRVTITLNV